MSKQRRSVWLISSLIYLTLIGFIEHYNFLKIFDAKSFGIVILGVIILTISQFKKGEGLHHLLSKASWNAFYSGLMATILHFLALISTNRAEGIVLQYYIEAMVPVLYGSLIYVILEWSIGNIEEITENENKELNPFDVKVVYEILTAKNFSQREIHVSLKMMEGQSNKEIATSLFISEATVKKHIQNMFKKCDATDRTHFIQLYKEWYDDSKK